MAKRHFRRPPTACVVGAGVTGLHVARALRNQGLRVVVFEADPLPGGVWRQHANRTSRVNTCEPAYRLDLNQGGNEDHSPTGQIRADVDALASGLEVRYACAVHDVGREESGQFRVRHAQGEDRYDRVVVCVNRRLGAPRAVPFEHTDGATVYRGLADDVDLSKLRGARVCVVGMGAFGIEWMRTALEHGAASVTIVARRTGVVCPNLIDWAHFARMGQSDARKRQTDAALFDLWRGVYAASAGCPPCWSRGGALKPDGHTISVSNLFFVAAAAGRVEVVEGAVERIVGRELYLAQRRLPCDVAIVCVGFHKNAALPTLLGSSTTRDIGLVEPGLWMLCEGHIDDQAFRNPFGSSVLALHQFMAEVIAHHCKRGDGALLRHPCTTPVLEGTVSGVHAAIQRMTDEDASMARLLQTHLARLQTRCKEEGPAAFLQRDARHWADLQRLVGDDSLDYPFADALPLFDPPAAAAPPPAAAPPRAAVPATPPPAAAPPPAVPAAPPAAAKVRAVLRSYCGEAELADAGLDSISISCIVQDVRELVPTVDVDELRTLLARDDATVDAVVSACGEATAPAPSGCSLEVLVEGTGDDAILAMPSIWGMYGHFAVLGRALGLPTWAVRVSGDASWERVRATLREATEALAPRRIHLVGASFGAMLARHAAEFLPPERRGVLLLVDAPPAGPCAPICVSNRFVAAQYVRVVHQMEGRAVPEDAGLDGDDDEWRLAAAAADRVAALRTAPLSYATIRHVVDCMRNYKVNMQLWQDPANVFRPDPTAVAVHVLSTGRTAFYCERLYATDDVHGYGRAVLARVESGEHTEVVNRTLRDPSPELVRAVHSALRAHSTTPATVE